MTPNYAIAMNETFISENEGEKPGFLKYLVNSILKANRLSKKNEELTLLVESQTRIISILAHDLRNPLTAIKSIMELKKTDIIDRNDAGRMMDLLTGQLNTTLEMVDNVVNWGQLYLQQGRLDFAEVNLFQLVEQIFNYENLSSSVKNNKLLNHIEPKTVVYSDGRILEFILRNLIDNANKFTESGTITISSEKGAKTTIIVSDTGVGMDAKCASLLFTRQHYSTRGTKNEKGSGLGLLLVKEFIDRLHGSISVQSARNKGTNFTIKL